MEETTHQQTNVSQATAGSSRLINPAVLDFFMTFNLLICGEVIGLIGIAGNIVNIIVFVKQGLTDSVNVTLTALAVSDLGALLTLQVTNLMINPWFLAADVPFLPLEVIRLISFYPHNYFIRVCGGVTAYAALERCACVVAPLKVKRIFTAKLALFVNIGIFCILVFNVMPAFAYSYLDWQYIPRFNVSKLTVTFRPNSNKVFSVSYFITDLFVPYFTFSILIVCTSVICFKLKSKAIWRKSVSSVKIISGEKVPSREKKTVVMLTTVSVIFVVCLIPQSAILTAVALYQELAGHGAYFEVALLCYIVSFLFETVNSSVNCLVYFKMSSRYRQTLISIYTRANRFKSLS